MYHSVTKQFCQGGQGEYEKNIPSPNVHSLHFESFFPERKSSYPIGELAFSAQD
jgi:hypothetical protein